MPGLTVARVVILTAFTLGAFAANSVLCRLALGGEAIDAASFSVVRLLSGALVLMSILAVRRSRDAVPARGSWRAAAMLFLYAVPFSYAYLLLDTGTGALILFGSVQITMIVGSLVAGNRLRLAEWCGVLIATGGFTYLNLPGVTAPSVPGFLLMAIAGAAWGVYTMLGRSSRDPVMDTGFNFLRTLPFMMLLVLIASRQGYYTERGVTLAILSGGLASGVGYSIWYSVLKNLTTVQAAVIQLLVPVVAAFGGVLFVDETITPRLAVAAAMILGGILLVIFARYTSLAFSGRNLLRWWYIGRQ